MSETCGTFFTDAAPITIGAASIDATTDQRWQVGPPGTTVGGRTVRTGRVHSCPSFLFSTILPMASLFVVRGRNQGSYFQLRSAVHRIGREGHCDIQLLDSEVSRTHAEIRCQATAGKYQLLDLGSSNGTRINGEKVQNHWLQSGDRIEIGQSLLIFTGTGLPASLDAAHGVDIVGKSRDSEASQIVSSLSRSAATGPPSASDAERSLEVIYRTAIAVGRGEDLDTVLDRILQLVFDWVDADRGCIMLKDPDTGQLQPAARCDRQLSKPNESLGKSDSLHLTTSPKSDSSSATNVNTDERIAISRTILDYVIDRREGVRTTDAKGDDRFESAASIVQAGVREALCVPLQGRYDIVGALYVDTYSSPGRLMQSGGQPRFTDEHLRLITAIGYQAALAIEDTFYYSALVQSERLAAMGQTIAMISHHVKNILQGIRGGSYLIDAGLKRDDNDAVRRGWSIVERNQDRISNLVLDMLSFSKEREPERIDADLNATVSDVIELMHSRARELDVQLGCDLADDLPTAKFDPDAIHRALLNLVTNAIDAAKAGVDAQDDVADSITEIQSIEQTTDDVSSTSDTLESLPPHAPTGPLAEDVPNPDDDQAKVFVQTKFVAGHGWRVDVIDNGLGVPPEQREKIFSLFESSKGSTGTGLGLPVSAKILREHDGDIQVLDSPVGRGSCFRIWLPCEETDDAGAIHSTTLPDDVIVTDHDTENS